MLGKRLTEEDLYSQVNDANIFHKYFGDFEVGTSYNSVFDSDEHPSTGFFVNANGKHVYHDFRSGKKWSAVEFVQELYGIDYYKALDKIAKDFGIIEDGLGVKAERAVKIYKPRLKPPKNYEVKVGAWKEEELEYWKQYFITEKELKENFVYPLRELKINNFVIENPENLLKFVYVVNGLDDKQYIKIYTPYSTDYKWMGNIKNDIPFGIADLPYKSKTLIITKGQKDRIIWKKFFTDVIAVQHESADSLKPNVIELINNNYDTVYVNFDVDKQWLKTKDYPEGHWFYLGKEATTELHSEYGWGWVNVPNYYYEKEGIKDFADLVKIKGLGLFKKYLKWKKLI